MVRYYLRYGQLFIDIIDLEEFDEPLEYDSFAVDTEEINQDDEESEVSVFTRDTLIKDVRRTLAPIEYPVTSLKNHPKDRKNPLIRKSPAYQKKIIIDEKDNNLTEINAIEERKVSLEERKPKLKQYEIDLKYK
ncbi:hypothetical protein GLOIN_2v1868797 [Rhizophagus irregularis DAOM 181602=DAOM 197198]|uniref:Uncharacterized protein n=1 Tax=Rhizophagus irregularis (strain DAOM 181602 / DAOM 197198 / MUCL 43194) TaxID=747089 RepID=A0A2P4QSM3_RHIID|nr:hypothetical protein GLOIN_2v1868797 [Rhizophagus irregularis DAOM 181602=DAOM 197198]POG80612.1 hypothetical protein GLOIN_2v1868797 [Rhizophagus irregularis DAOM 181602=DAOM 197198]|eukprot:XP_025187478.1 hypothetical protein GLOIN_2v1868797 [Rhizophagus irregularis DAOM 181602=DAOM 197198]